MAVRRTHNLMTVSFSSSRLLSSRRAAALAASALVLSLVAGCGAAPKRPAYDPEAFGSTNTHTRAYPAHGSAQTCEAARRALLSQGYSLGNAHADSVNGKKSFQPANETHVEVELRVVCAPSAEPGRGSTVFVTAVQDRYALKKASTSASVGVGVLGSVSLPFAQSDDAMVKVASETLTDERFYQRFYALLDRFLAAVPSGDKPGDAADALSPPAAR